MSTKLNELSNNVIVTIQGAKKQGEALEALRSLYFYLRHSNEVLTSTTFNVLLGAFQVTLDCASVGVWGFGREGIALWSVGRTLPTFTN